MDCVKAGHENINLFFGEKIYSPFLHLPQRISQAFVSVKTVPCHIASPADALEIVALFEISLAGSFALETFRFHQHIVDFHFLSLFYSIDGSQMVHPEVFPSDKFSIWSARVVRPSHDGAEHCVLPIAHCIRVEPPQVVRVVRVLAVVQAKHCFSLGLTHPSHHHLKKGGGVFTVHHIRDEYQRRFDEDEIAGIKLSQGHHPSSTFRNHLDPTWWV